MFNLGEISMKKSLVALAALAATGAFAQSSVTLYGVAEATVDVGYKNSVNTRTDAFNAAGVVTAGTATANNTQKSGFRVQDGNSQGVGTSRLGWRGNEDLGGGLKANFQMEMGIRLDDGCTTDQTSTCAVGGSGNSGGNTFGRNAWVGASGGFGEVRLGRQVLGSFGVQGNSWVAGSSSGLYETGANTAPLMGGVRFANAIKYISPNLGGFSGTVSLRAPEGSGTTSTGTANPATTNTSNKTGLDLSAEYANGPLYVGVGYNKVKGTIATNTALGLATNVGVATGTATTGTTIGASYNLGVVQPFFNYSRAKTDNTSVTNNAGVVASGNGTSNHKAFALGLKAPVGPATIIASFGRGKITGNTSNIAAGALASTVGNNGKLTAFQVGAQYALSKRTMLEVNYGQIKNDATTRTTGFAAGASIGGSIANSNGKESALNFGVRHAF
jgi:predicted porin